uniref:Neurotransmitter-gated ion-channel ligand-binding domain-containing protein n=1 Tax=Chromera velia CCMP2878 TaxID=1169474 RepID=A0A0G4HWX0_9ALVE|eukprot:Cvel_9140.t1-p1 / transcript=Cvel_9140.t1 / gene=Cvel_9140 / organism=Chromera_velia_CCMP2878 / gene_product=Cys-loop ligand-gated ion channel, putative / transcript_product=Cys-loop ligand-gated ion channel, putative / location=Cvel_scaffold520:8073-16760(-) / protein_length=842 / sequence_SO=supercontig / SO=protein_coding / is_pseudo=false
MAEGSVAPWPERLGRYVGVYSGDYEWQQLTVIDGAHIEWTGEDTFKGYMILRLLGCDQETVEELEIEEDDLETGSLQARSYFEAVVDKESKTFVIKSHRIEHFHKKRGLFGKGTYVVELNADNSAMIARFPAQDGVIFFRQQKRDLTGAAIKEAKKIREKERGGAQETVEELEIEEDDLETGSLQARSYFEAVVDKESKTFVIKSHRIEHFHKKRGLFGKGTYVVELNADNSAMIARFPAQDGVIFFRQQKRDLTGAAIKEAKKIREKERGGAQEESDGKKKKRDLLGDGAAAAELEIDEDQREEVAEIDSILGSEQERQMLKDTYRKLEQMRGDCWEETGPHEVLFSIEVPMLSNVDNLLQTFEAAFAVTYRWKVSESDIYAYTLNPDNWRPSWVPPDFDILNAIEWKEVGPSQQEENGKVRPVVLFEPKKGGDEEDEHRPLHVSATLQSIDTKGLKPTLYAQKCLRFRSVMSEGLELESFPFDCQNFKVFFGQSDVPTSEMILNPDADENGNFVKVNQNLSALTEWDVRPPCLDLVTHRKNEMNEKLELQNVAYQSFVLVLRGAREWTVYAWRIFFVLSMLMLVANLAFALHPVDSLSDRLSLGVTLLLTCIAYSLVVGSSLPMLGYLTILDKYITASYVYISFVLIANAAVGSDILTGSFIEKFAMTVFRKAHDHTEAVDEFFMTLSLLIWAVSHIWLFVQICAFIIPRERKKLYTHWSEGENVDISRSVFGQGSGADELTVCADKTHTLLAPSGKKMGVTYLHRSALELFEDQKKESEALRDFFRRGTQTSMKLKSIQELSGELGGDEEGETGNGGEGGGEHDKETPLLTEEERRLLD